METRTIHAAPGDDLIGHEVDDDGACVCGPTEHRFEVFGVPVREWRHQRLDGQKPMTITMRRVQ
jgi:hypothetical protein